MHFREWFRGRQEPVEEGNRGVTQPGRVDEHPVHALADLGQIIEDPPFAIGLEGLDPGPEFAAQILQRPVDVLERVRTVHLRLTDSEKIEIGAVHDGNPHWAVPFA